MLQLHWWMWAIVGLILLGIELLSGTFYLLWLAMAALGVALLLVVYPSAPFALQLLMFSLLAIGLVVLWKHQYRQRQPSFRIGQSRDDTIGKTGRIIQSVNPDHTGVIHFAVPVMGSQEWTVLSEETIAIGEQAEVVAVEGNYLRVRRKI